MRIRPFFLLTWMAVASLLGWLLLLHIPMSWMPAQEGSRIFLQLPYPGASPREVERQLCAEAEAELAQLAQLDNIESVSAAEMASIELTFQSGAKLDLLELEIRTRLQGLYERLEVPLPFPQILREKPSGQEKTVFMTFAIQSSDPGEEMAGQVASLVHRHLDLLAGLSRVELAGEQPPWLELQVNPLACQRWSLTFDAISKSLARAGSSQSLGICEEGPWRWVIESNSGAISWETLGELVVGVREGQVVRLHQVATWHWIEAPKTSYFRVNGQQTLHLLLEASASANLIDLANRVYPAIAAIEAELPPGYRIECLQDESLFLRNELRSLMTRTVLGLGLLVLVLYISTLDVKYLVFLLVCLALNTGLALLTMYLLGLHLHLYSLAGFSISFGLMVDNAILVLHARRGENGEKATLPVLAATLTSLASLAAVWLLPEELKGLLIDFCAIVAICLGSSLLVAALAVPALVHLFPDRPSPNSRSASPSEPHPFIFRGMSWSHRHRWLVFGLMIWGFGLPVGLLPERADEAWPWADFYNQQFDNQTFREQTKPKLEKYLGGLSGHFFQQLSNSSWSDKPQRTRIVVGVVPANSWSVAQLNAVFLRLEAWLATWPDGIAQVETHVQQGPFGRLTILVSPEAGHTDLPLRLQTALQALTLEYSDIEWSVHGIGSGFSSFRQEKTNFSLTLQGYHYEKLDAISRAIGDSLKQHPKVREIKLHASLSWQPEHREMKVLALHPGAMSRAGISPLAVVDHLNNWSLSPRMAGSFWLEDHPRRVPFQVKARGYDSQDLHEMKAAALPSGDLLVPFGSLAEVATVPAEARIHKTNQQYLRRITYTFAGSKSFGEKHLERLAENISGQLPPGFQIRLPQAANWQPEDQRHLAAILVLVVALIFLIATLLFESLVFALMIIAIIPLSYLGLFATGWIWDLPYDSGAFAAMILLAGITVNHTLYLGFSIRQLPTVTMAAMLQLFRQKTLPIFLTTLSTCAGMVPMVMGEREPFWFSFAASSLGGLLPATLLIFLVFPLLFRRLPDTARRKGPPKAPQSSAAVAGESVPMP